MPLTTIDSANLSTLNTFGVAARARRLVILDNEADTGRALALLQSAHRTLLLGAGSNVLFTSDFDGTILKVALTGRAVIGPARAAPDAHDSATLVEAAAGEPWHQFVLWTLSQGLYGLENLALIPGSVGAAPVQNIGAYGVELRERLHSVRAVSVDSGEQRVFLAADCGFAYRESRFRTANGQPSWLILAVRFALSRIPSPRLSYPDLKATFADASAPPHPEQIANAVCAIRQRKLPDPATLGNAGSFFRNPLMTIERAEQLSHHHPELPVYPDRTQPGFAKIPAAWLIERCGWKGYRRGDAGVHAQHALVLVNHGRAHGAEIAALANDIRLSVADRFGVTLAPEVVIV